ncbi:MAG TPA: OmpA family protein [Bacillota bacterium]|nr:OmpA family protein [Bacillota bacterium]
MFRKSFGILAVSLFLIVFSQLSTLGCPTPKLQAISPAKGFPNQTLKVSITGSGFHRSSSVKLTMQGQPDILATEVTVAKTKDQISCSFDLRNKAVGKWDLVVSNKSIFANSNNTNNRKTATLVAGFTIAHPAPSLTSVTPVHGLNNAKIAITISGVNFQDAAVIKLDRTGQNDIPALNVTLSASEIICDFDLTGVSPGKYNLTVTNPDGQSGSLPDAFLVEGKPDFSRLKPILFDYDKYTLRVDQLAVLNGDIADINRTPNEYIVLGGHSAEQGTKEYNLILSSKRAETVKEYLVKAGINPEKIIVFAYGSLYPSGQSDANRRVDITLWQRKPTKEEAL